jgi:acyl-CoA thioester hydrolase
LKSGVFRIRVRYPEVDRMGVAHHGNFFTWFEIGRTELMRELGARYATLEDDGYLLPVVEASCRYLAPVRYDDLVEVETRVAEVGASLVAFSYVLRRSGESTVLAEGKTVHATVNRGGEVVRLPASARDLLARP